MSTVKTDWPAESELSAHRGPRERLHPVTAVVLVIALLTMLALAVFVVRGPDRSERPARVSRSYFAEKDAKRNATGRLCTQVVAQAGAGVAVGLSCSYPPAESRLASILEGAGQ